MAVIAVSLPSDGTTADVSDYNTPITTIVNEINGNLDNTNIAASAAIAGTKLASGGVGTTQLADSSVTNAKLSTTAGEPGSAWQTWVPSYANFTLSNGTVNYAKYIQIGKTVFFRLKITLGNSSSVSGNIGIGLPVAFNAEYTQVTDALNATGQLNDATAQRWMPRPMWGDTQRMDIYYQSASSGFLSVTSSTAPFTWTTSDQIMITGSYEAA